MTRCGIIFLYTRGEAWADYEVARDVFYEFMGLGLGFEITMQGGKLGIPWSN